MPEEFPHLNEEERLKVENEFLKMKMMLENGAEFGKMETDTNLPPQIENDFLNYIAEFEKQSENPKYISVFEKIEKPVHFKAVTEIPENEIERAWNELSVYLSKYNISLDVCSPNISKKELYRFTTEELFQHEMSDMNIPGMMHGFIYDEFHPDPVYDNTRTAKEECINYILEKESMQWTHNFKDVNLRLNQHYPLTIEQFKNLVNQFKLAYDNLEIIEIAEVNCVVNDAESRVTGIFQVNATLAGTLIPLSGKWKVFFELDKELGYWYINQVNVEGIAF